MLAFSASHLVLIMGLGVQELLIDLAHQRRLRRQRPANRSDRHQNSQLAPVASRERPGRLHVQEPAGTMSPSPASGPASPNVNGPKPASNAPPLPALLPTG